MRIKYITSVVLTACTCLCFTACNKAGSGIVPVAPLQMTINDQPHSKIKPLIVVDGVVFDDVIKLKVSPNDIKSMTVLRSSATNNLVDTYGPKAKDGVILVSTKKSK
ncbi:hypothetical protein [Spirosoma pomorum]|jgi:hypothetical protein